MEIAGVQLDYSVASLEKVDAMIEDMRRDGSSSNDIPATLFEFGCYVGEVFVHCAGGQWRKTSETPMADWAGFPLVIQLGEKIFCNPIDKVFKQLDNGEEDNLPYFYRVFIPQR